MVRSSFLVQRTGDTLRKNGREMVTFHVAPALARKYVGLHQPRHPRREVSDIVPVDGETKRMAHQARVAQPEAEVLPMAFDVGAERAPTVRVEKDCRAVRTATRQVPAGCTGALAAAQDA
jgi:hypothetical protein